MEIRKGSSWEAEMILIKLCRSLHTGDAGEFVEESHIKIALYVRKPVLKYSAALLQDNSSYIYILWFQMLPIIYIYQTKHTVVLFIEDHVNMLYQSETLPTTKLHITQVISCICGFLDINLFTYIHIRKRLPVFCRWICSTMVGIWNSKAKKVTHFESLFYDSTKGKPALENVN